MSGIPPIHEVERTLREARSELDWLLDQQGRSGPYRWAMSGLDGVKSQTWDGGRAGSLPESLPETAADGPTSSRLRDAARAITNARDELRRARDALRSSARGKLEPGRLLGRGFATREELREARAMKAKREARGEGWGQA